MESVRETLTFPSPYFLLKLLVDGLKAALQLEIISGIPLTCPPYLRRSRFLEILIINYYPQLKK